MKTEIEPKDLMDEYIQNYNQGITILSRTQALASKPKKVNIYIDGLLTSLPVDMFNRLVETGYYRVISRELTI